ncbi:MAG: hypothetical protein HZT40_20790 [Candidatus Thiothrix singaporensis]|uniref:Uncharacterized protein n=1 Tax=Candidatus Thiothrix singaporensis TaxID=2799669 RepID=A0A7L6AMG7_9GAMM|nr:MAG: hypothetical protein HZT40_20790 [Candidatus Thiothrix singaporensis]
MFVIHQRVEMDEILQRCLYRQDGVQPGDGLAQAFALFGVERVRPFIA